MSASRELCHYMCYCICTNITGSVKKPMRNSKDRRLVNIELTPASLRYRIQCQYRQRRLSSGDGQRYDTVTTGESEIDMVSPFVVKGSQLAVLVRSRKPYLRGCEVNTLLL